MRSYTAISATTIRRSAMSLAAALTALVLTVAPALAAGHKSLSDKRGDAPARADITKLNYSWTNDMLVATTHFRNLGPTGVLRLSVSSSNQLVVVKKSAGKAQLYYQYFSEEGQAYPPAKCGKVTWSAAKSQITIHAPRDNTCLESYDIDMWVFGAKFRAGAAHDLIGRMVTG